MLDIDIKKTVCLTGHREIYGKDDLKDLDKIFIGLIEKGYDTFLIGMAIGFDTVGFQTLERLRKDNSIKLIACIPCPNQEKFFSTEQKEEYNRMVSVSDDKIIICPSYTAYCMNKRNRFMVDNSSVVVAYLKQEKGGTYNTVKYASNKQKEIIFI